MVMKILVLTVERLNTISAWNRLLQLSTNLRDVSSLSNMNAWTLFLSSPYLIAGESHEMVRL